MFMMLRSPTEKAATAFCAAEARLAFGPRKRVKVMVQRELLASLHIPLGKNEQARYSRNHPLLHDTIRVAVVVQKSSSAAEPGCVTGVIPHAHHAMHLLRFSTAHLRLAEMD